MKDKSSSINRRQFMTYAAAAGVATIVPRHVLGGRRHIPPSETIQVAGVGIGGVGHGQIQSIGKQPGTKIAVLCDVDDRYAARTYKVFPKARRYRDFREMLQTEGDKIDGVYCGTPDHTHAVIVLPAAVLVLALLRVLSGLPGQGNS